MRASSILNREAGISTSSWSATIPFLIRVRKSAIGSVIDIRLRSLPARLRESRHVAVVGHLAQADAAEAELAEVRAWPSAALAAVVLPGLELLRPPLTDDLRRLCHVST